MPEDENGTDQTILLEGHTYQAEVVVPPEKSTDASIADAPGLAIVVGSSPEVSLSYPVKEMSRRHQVLKENRKLPAECTS